MISWSSEVGGRNLFISGMLGRYPGLSEGREGEFWEGKCFVSAVGERVGEDLMERRIKFHRDAVRRRLRMS